MEPLKRQILFDKKAGKIDKPKEPKKADPVPEEKKVEPEPPKKDIEDKLKESKNPPKSDKIKWWFEAHPLVSVNGICAKADVDTSNFKKMLKSGKILPDRLIEKLEPIIKEYGYEDGV